MQVYVARQAILDRNHRVWAYELLYRSNGLQTEFDGTDGTVATRQVIANSLLAIGLNRILGGKRATINFNRAMLLQDWSSILPRKHMIIEILEDVPADAEVLAAVRGLREQGYQIALDDFVDDPSREALVDLANILKIEISTPREQQQEILRRYKSRGILFLAEKVETQEQFEWARDAGYQYFQGNYFTRPIIMEGQQIPAGRLQCLQLIQETQRPEMNFDKLEALVTQDVSLTYKLIRCANSAHYGRRQNVQSIRRAFVVLGEPGIRKWVSIAALTAVASGKPDELLTRSLLRARFCEQVAGQTRFAGEERAFLVGLFSLLDALLDRNLEEALTELRVGPPVDAVLLGLAPDQSPLNSIYRLACSYETASWDQVDHFVERLSLSPELASEAYGEALAWTSEVTRA